MNSNGSKSPFEGGRGMSISSYATRIIELERLAPLKGVGALEKDKERQGWLDPELQGRFTQTLAGAALLRGPDRLYLYRVHGSG
ncbi:hypothetical protein OB13_15130 [Pontibacter sp. HJ8]